MCELIPMQKYRLQKEYIQYTIYRYNRGLQIAI